MEAARGIAWSFRGFPAIDDLEAELFKRLVELKRKGKHTEVTGRWRDYLAKSLYNAARDFIRRWKARRESIVSLDLELAVEQEGWLKTMEDTLATPDAPVELKLAVRQAWNDLAPELRELWWLLVEERGNVAALARRLGKPERTVRYWIKKKIKDFLHKRGFG